MRENGGRGVALGMAIAITLGASSGVLASRWSADAAPRAHAVPAILSITLEPGSVLRLPDAARPDPEPLTRAPCGAEGGRLVRFRVAVRDGVGMRPAAFARAVREILCDARGWIASGRVRFAYHPRGEVVVSLNPAAETERRCLDLVGLSVRYTYSCAGSSEAVLNARRWFDGSPTLDMTVRQYRRLLVNHEVGHVLGHGHRGCPAAGARAPVMMQQSKGLNGCRPNPWPRSYELAATR